MQNAQLTNYIIPTAPDMPPIDVVLRRRARTAHGPGGAKGVGELPMDVPGPAVAAAVVARHGGVRSRRCRSFPSASHARAPPIA